MLDLPIAAAAEAVESYLALMEIKMVNVAPETARIALGAYDRYGKGRHPARLNFGDCFAYVCARHLGEPLVFKAPISRRPTSRRPDKRYYRSAPARGRSNEP